jgi:vitamin B12 transporter
MVHRLRTYLLGLFLWSSSAVGEPLEITIYLMRSASDLQHKTYTHDYIEAESYKDLDLNIVQSGTEGQMSSTFVRGTNSNHTLFTLNGMPIKDHSTPTGVDDIGQHSMIGVNSVEIIKGPMATVYGPNAVGGVVNMTSFATTEKYIDFSMGSNNTQTQTVKYGEYINNHLIDFTIQNKKSDGISVYPQGDEKDGFETQNYNLKTTSAIGGYWINTNFNSKHNETDLDNSGSDALNYTSDWKFNNQYIDILSPSGNSKLAFNNVTHERTYNNNGTVDTYDSNTKTLLGTHTIKLDKTDISLGIENENVNADFDTQINGYVSSVDKKRKNQGYFVNTDTLLTDDLLLTLGTRYDNLSSFDDQQTYRIGLGYNGWRTSYSTAYKAPTVYEMYGQDNFGFLGNPNLSPENSKTYEIGYGNKHIDFALYRTEIDNLLVYQGNTYQNDSATSTRKGADVTLKAHKGNIRFLNKTDYVIAQDSDGNELVRRPQWSNNMNITWYDNKNTSVSADWNYYGSHVDIDSNTWQRKDVGGVSTFDLSAKHTKNKVTYYTNINNLFDKQYERPDGYNQNGRTLTAGIKINF